MLKQLLEWCKEAGDDVQIEFIQYLKDQTLTSIEPGNIWYFYSLNKRPRSFLHSTVLLCFTGGMRSRQLANQCRLNNK
jgi:hypothetical protein